MPEVGRAMHSRAPGASPARAPGHRLRLHEVSQEGGRGRAGGGRSERSVRRGKGAAKELPALVSRGREVSV